MQPHDPGSCVSIPWCPQSFISLVWQRQYWHWLHQSTRWGFVIIKQTSRHPTETYYLLVFTPEQKKWDKNNILYVLWCIVRAAVTEYESTTSDQSDWRIARTEKMQPKNPNINRIINKIKNKLKCWDTHTLGFSHCTALAITEGRGDWLA